MRRWRGRAGSGPRRGTAASPLVAFNTLWSGVFFGLRNLRAALLIMAALFASVLVTTVAVWQADRIAGALMAL